MSQRYERKAKNFFIKKNFQGRMILAVFIVVVVSCLLFAALLGMFSADTMTISYENNNLKFGQTPTMLLKNALAANWIFLVTCGTLIVLLAIVGTHRIAGPLFRFEKALDTMNDKNLSSTIFLRGKDEGKELALKINSFNETLSQDLKSVKQHSKAIDNLVKQYQHMDKKEVNIEEIDSLYIALSKTNNKIYQLANSYKLIDE